MAVREESGRTVVEEPSRRLGAEQSGAERVECHDLDSFDRGNLARRLLEDDDRGPGRLLHGRGPGYLARHARKNPAAKRPVRSPHRPLRRRNAPTPANSRLLNGPERATEPRASSTLESGLLQQPANARQREALHVRRGRERGWLAGIDGLGPETPRLRRFDQVADSPMEQEPAHAEPVPEELLHLEPTVPVRHGHQEPAAGREPAADLAEKRPQLVVVEVLEHLGDDDHVRLDGHGVEGAGGEDLRVEALGREESPAVLDARRVEVDPVDPVARASRAAGRSCSRSRSPTSRMSSASATWRRIHSRRLRLPYTVSGTRSRSRPCGAADRTGQA